MNDTRCWQCLHTFGLGQFANDGRCFTCYREALSEEDKESTRIIELIDTKLRLVIREELKKLLDKIIEE